MLNWLSYTDGREIISGRSHTLFPFHHCPPAHDNLITGVAIVSVT